MVLNKAAAKKYSIGSKCDLFRDYCALILCQLWASVSVTHAKCSVDLISIAIHKSIYSPIIVAFPICKVVSWSKIVVIDDAHNFQNNMSSECV